ncbi:TIM barrel protein [Reinekea forsetii]|jgi:inosose dehydratase|uniref:TIM barrel protein n=1 Tax=Reinekea forsetii TaxID=1336806 RepID=UPI0023558A08|nr:TIM barrel protein [Reinekea forsetii]
MAIRIGNAPCSWGVEFADDPRNPPWQQVLQDCAAAGYRGIELGPVGYLPEDRAQLDDALQKEDLTLTAGVVFQPFHDANGFAEVFDTAERTAKALASQGAQHLVLIDSISARRAPTAGRPSEAEQLSSSEWQGFVERIKTVSKMARDDYGLTVSIHSHAAGFMDFHDELERLMQEVDADLLKLCIDTGHQTYAGFDPINFMERYYDRLAYVHCKDIDPKIKADVILQRTDFYKACGDGIFCNLGQGEVKFDALHKLLTQRGYQGWMTVEQDCDPLLEVSPLSDAIANREFLASMGF